MIGRRWRLGVLVACVALLDACCPPDPRCRPSPWSGTVPRASQALDDAPLSEWPNRSELWRTPSAGGRFDHFAAIRHRTASAVTTGDVQLSLRSAIHGTDWYVRIDVEDDERVDVASDPDHPYRGDCFELFFAGHD